MVGLEGEVAESAGLRERHENLLAGLQPVGVDPGVRQQQILNGQLQVVLVANRFNHILKNIAATEGIPIAAGDLG